MKWVADKTGRFHKRPYYLPGELDTACERAVVEFLTHKYGEVTFPIATDDLTILIEQEAELDSYADLSAEGKDVEGITEFVPGGRPIVRIARALQASYLENRLRTTLSHEWGHVHFHRCLFDASRPSSLAGGGRGIQTNKCRRDKIVNAAEPDWMEWQAGYICAAMLMPASALADAVQRFRAQNKLLFRPIVLNSAEGQRLIDVVAATFQASKDAARVRLIQRQMLIDSRRRARAQS